MKHLIFALFMTSILATSEPIHADAGHAHGPKHGGVAREVGKMTFELVARNDSLTLYVSDHGKPVSTRDAKAEAIVYAGNDNTVVTLTPAGENTLVAKGSFKTGVGVRVAASVTLAGQKETRLTFNLR